jgi:AcrR family transcriptional regulator
MNQTARQVLDRNGKPLGLAGQRTRTAMLEELLELLNDGAAWHRITPAMLARGANVSAPAFYDYFAGTENAAAALIDELRDTRRAVPEHLKLIGDLIEHEAQMAREAGPS